MRTQPLSVLPLVLFLSAAVALGACESSSDGTGQDNGTATDGATGTDDTAATDGGTGAQDTAGPEDATGSTDDGAGTGTDDGTNGTTDTPCQPDCAGKECGDDGCGATCGECTGDTPICNDVGVCEAEPVQGVDWATEIEPIFDDKGCNNNGCHSATSGAAGLVTDSVAGILAGGAHGAAVVPCDSSQGTLLPKLSSTPPFGSTMPLLNVPLTADELQLLTDWIDQGAGETFDAAACD